MRQSTWYAVLFPAGLAAVMTPAILLAAGGGGFDAVVHGIESRYHGHATRIPFMGLISGMARLSTHGGVRGLHVAEIENLQGPVDGAELNALVEQRVGLGWQRMIRETGREGQQTLIYLRPEGDRMGMLVVDLDGREVNVVQLSADPKHLDDDMGHFRHTHDKGHDDGTADDGKQNDSDSD